MHFYALWLGARTPQNVLAFRERTFVTRACPSSSLAGSLLQRALPDITESFPAFVAHPPPPLTVGFPNFSPETQHPAAPQLGPLSLPRDPVGVT